MEEFGVMGFYVIGRCGRGPAPKPYNCTGYTKETVKCKKEGLYPNPWDTSVFFRWVMNIYSYFW